MAGRPRKVSDEEVFAAVYRVMNRLGPAQMTLAEVASEAGVTPSALVQRFGSKRELLLAVTRGAAEETGRFLADLRQAHASPLETLRAYGECFAGMADSPETLAHHLGWLQLDLTDPGFRRHAREQARVGDRAIRELLAEAVAAGELAAKTDLEALGRAVTAVLGGSLLAWAIRQRGSAAKWIAADLEAVLAPHRPARRRARSRARPHPD